VNLKNYTSTVSIDRSVTMIEHCLVSAGAQHIAKSYNEKKDLARIIFQMEVAPGQPRMFKLPVRWDKVFKKMWRDVLKPHKGTEDRVRDQAQRTAWKLLYDMVAVQVSNILIEQQDAAEAFLPYLYNGKTDRTLYEAAKENGFKALLTDGK
jgi:hypothetical protein